MLSGSRAIKKLLEALIAKREAAGGETGRSKGNEDDDEWEDADDEDVIVEAQH